MESCPVTKLGCSAYFNKFLGDPNNELSSEQQSKLKKGVRSLKKLRRATNLSHQQVFVVVSEIAEVAFEMIKTRSSE